MNRKGEIIIQSKLIRISDSLYQYPDTCHVYVVIGPNRNAVLIDFGTGDVLDHLHELEISDVSGVLMTHHHRDQGQGLPRAAAAGIPVWVPHTEQDLFQYAEEHWQSREIYNNYNMREDRFSILTSVPIAGTLKDYATFEIDGASFRILPTPGHTLGSISLITEIDGATASFTGDLIYEPGKVWSLAAMQWGYNDMSGVCASILSLGSLKECKPDLLLPSHGEPMPQPEEAMALLVERFQRFLRVRHGQGDFTLEVLCKDALTELTPHLLMNRRCNAFSYVLLSDSGKAMFIDYGYEHPFTGGGAGSDRSSRRPLPVTPRLLKQQYGVHTIDVIMPTHYHDDHVAGCNVLREVEGTQVWAAENFADRLEYPEEIDLPCLWYDPIPVDRRLPLNTPVVWEEYEITLYELPGHTLYAAAISFTVDGKKVLAIGDQQGTDGYPGNYVHKNGFRAGDYKKSGELYQRLQPDLMIGGHWDPLWVEEGYLDKLVEYGEGLEASHDELLPIDRLNYGISGFCAAITPFQMKAEEGETIRLQVSVLNPDVSEAELAVQLVYPVAWKMEGPVHNIRLAAHERGTVAFEIKAPVGLTGRKQRIAADISSGDRKFGQQAEMLIHIVNGGMEHA